MSQAHSRPLPPILIHNQGSLLSLLVMVASALNQPNLTSGPARSNQNLQTSAWFNHKLVAVPMDSMPTAKVVLSLTGSYPVQVGSMWTPWRKVPSITWKASIEVSPVSVRIAWELYRKISWDSMVQTGKLLKMDLKIYNGRLTQINSFSTPPKRWKG